jgi:hypothetical protein
MLTALAIENAKPRDKPYKLSDGNGLHLLIAGSSKLWRFRYQFDRKERMISFGAFPEISLAAARSKCLEARKLLADGKDPSQQRKLDKLTAATAANNTFGAIAQERIKTLEESGAAKVTVDKNRWLLLNLAAPLTDRPISEITPAEILVILKRLETSGRRETARRLRGVIGAVFRLAVATAPDAQYRALTLAALLSELVAPLLPHRPPPVSDHRCSTATAGPSLSLSYGRLGSAFLVLV